MKQLLLISSLGLFSIPSAFTNQIHCANSTGELRLSVSSYDGGAPPPPELVVYQETWFYKGSILGEKTTQENGSTTPMDLTAEFDDSTKVVLETIHNPDAPLGTTVYVQKASLARKSGEAVYPDHPEQKKISEYMICSEIFYTIPPP